MHLRCFARHCYSISRVLSEVHCPVSAQGWVQLRVVRAGRRAAQVASPPPSLLAAAAAFPPTGLFSARWRVFGQLVEVVRLLLAGEHTYGRGTHMGNRAEPPQTGDQGYPRSQSHQRAPTTPNALRVSAIFYVTEASWCSALSWAEMTDSPWLHWAGRSWEDIVPAACGTGHVLVF